MSFDGIKRADVSKGNKGDRIKLGYGPNGEPAHYRLKITGMRGAEEPEPPVLPWIAVDFEVMESDVEELPVGEACSHGWTVGGQWGHLGFQDAKAFLALALDLAPAKAAEIDKAVVLFCIGADQPTVGTELRCTVTKKVRGPKSAKAGEPFAHAFFSKG